MSARRLLASEKALLSRNKEWFAINFNYSIFRSRLEKFQVLIALTYFLENMRATRSLNQQSLMIRRHFFCE